ncbi:hypothetical protein ACS0TY_028233 [Phlomoides rotata]
MKSKGDVLTHMKKKRFVRYAFKCHRQSEAGKDIVYAVNAIAFHPMTIFQPFLKLRIKITRKKHLSDVYDLLKDVDGNNKEGVDIEGFKLALSHIDKQMKSLPATAQVAADQGAYLSRCFNMREKYVGLIEKKLKNRIQWKWLYVTEEDIKNLPCSQNETLIAIKAPHGTFLEVPDPDKAVDYPQRRYKIVLRSTMGPIDVYLVSQFEKFEEINTVEAEPQPTIRTTSTAPTEEIGGSEIDVQAQRMCSVTSTSQNFPVGIMKIVPGVRYILPLVTWFSVLHLQSEADYWLSLDVDDVDGNNKEGVDIEGFKLALSHIDKQMKCLHATAQVAAGQGAYLARCFNMREKCMFEPEGPQKFRSGGRHEFLPFRYFVRLGNKSAEDILSLRMRRRMCRWLCCTYQVEESYHPHEIEHLKSPRNNADGFHGVKTEDLHVLAYEFATMGPLHDILTGRKGVQGAQPGPTLDWMQRERIAVDVARGLEYLHEKVQPLIIHRDIRSSNGQMKWQRWLKLISERQRRRDVQSGDDEQCVVEW